MTNDCGVQPCRIIFHPDRLPGLIDGHATNPINLAHIAERNHGCFRRVAIIAEQDLDVGHATIISICGMPGTPKLEMLGQERWYAKAFGPLKSRVRAASRGRKLLLPERRPRPSECRVRD